MTGGRGRGRGRCIVKRRIWGAVEEKRSLEESIQMVERIVGKKMRELTEQQKKWAKMINPPTLIFTDSLGISMCKGRMWEKDYTPAAGTTQKYGILQKRKNQISEQAHKQVDRERRECSFPLKY